jgi:hypothetical protein
MAQAIRDSYEPLYDVDPYTGARIEVFYADTVLARSFGKCRGWFWWSCLPGCLPYTAPNGPFATSYGAFRAVLTPCSNSTQFGRRQICV